MEPHGKDTGTGSSHKICTSGICGICFLHGGEIHPDYSAYSENYMGNPEKTTGLFSMDYDRLSEDTAQIYKQQFRQAQENGSLLWQTVLSFDNQWLEELEIYDPTSQTLDESRVRGMTRVFMKTLLEYVQPAVRLEHDTW